MGENYNLMLSKAFQFMLGDIPIVVSYWTALLMAIFVIDAFRYLRRVQEDESTPLYLTSAFFGMAIVIISLVLHESAHGLAIHSFGLPVVQAGMSGWGAYVAYNNDATLLQKVVIHLVGPFTNAILAVLFLIVVKVFPENLFENTIQYAGIVNWNLFLLNLSPLFVTDGGQTLEHLLSMTGASGTTITAVSFLAAAAVLYYIFWFRSEKKLFLYRKAIEEASYGTT